MTTIYVEGIKSYTKETSEMQGDYIKIYNFEYNAKTTCKLLDGTALDPKDVLLGTQLGIYNCLIKNNTSTPKVSEFTKDYKDLGYAFVTLLAAGIVCFGISK